MRMWLNPSTTVGQALQNRIEELKDESERECE